jgi:hypothetical protein
MTIATNDNYDLKEKQHREGAQRYGAHDERVLLNLTGARRHDLAVEPPSDIAGTASSRT